MWSQDSASIDSNYVIPLSDVHFTAEPLLGRHLGNTLYDMDIRDFAEDGTPVRIRSQLIFPLDVNLVGLRANLSGKLGGRHVQITASYAQELSDPGNPMEDSDWFGVGRGPAELFSYTQSEANISFRQWSLEGRAELLRRSRTRIDLLAGLRRHRVVQSVIGYDGWYLDDSGVRRRQAGSQPAIYYKATFWLPNVGFGFNITMSEVTRSDISLAYALVRAYDYDDHLLRYKTAIATGWGHGFLGSLRVERLLGEAATPTRPFLAFALDYTYIGVNGSQVQSWYGDEEATPENEYGLVISGLPHKFSASQLLASFRIGLRF